jgi:uncharacterized protein (DUF1501 family)
MTRTVILGDIAHARAGDKGNDSLLVLVPYDEADFEPLRCALTTNRLAEHFSLHQRDSVTVSSAPGLKAIVLVLRERLGGGVTRSTGPDPHGKTLSSHLLEMRLELHPGWAG